MRVLQLELLARTEVFGMLAHRIENLQLVLPRDERDDGDADVQSDVDRAIASSVESAVTGGVGKSEVD